ncbi:MAG: hypothetical protein IT210_04960 [Armatimonadetes bacterium]|nr:hypothetical protein [Armatimonadota bacterium]
MKLIAIILIFLWLLDAAIFFLHKDRRKKQAAWQRLKLDLLLYLLAAAAVYSIFRHIKRL